eukprot:COSAG06_NODE_9565_length_1869_cov_7.707345_4_plen_77_part_00
MLKQSRLVATARPTAGRASKGTGTAGTRMQIHRVILINFLKPLAFHGCNHSSCSSALALAMSSVLFGVFATVSPTL